MAKLLYIKNMVCPRCIIAVENVLDEMQIPIQKVELGNVHLMQELSEEQTKQFAEKIEALGFELLLSNSAQLISEIKTEIIKQIHHNTEPLTVNFSDFLSDKLGYDYPYLSRLFSSVEGVTINRYIVTQKIEKVKELLFYEELSTAEIAHQLNYSNVAYLSSVFKKETGITLSQFKALHNPKRKPISDL